MKKFLHKNYLTLLFLVALAGVSWFYGYQEMVFKRPQSIHKWRQSDCASIALNYYQGGMHFFSPEVHSLVSDGGTSGKCFPSEVPILYYTVAILYKIFGYHDYVYRVFNTLLFFLGLFFLFRLLRYVLKDGFWSIFLTLLFFTSPVLVYYGNNYLTNSSSFSFSLIAWYYFTRFMYESKNKWFYISMLWFFLAAAFKITALLSLLAIAGIYLLEMFKLKRFRENGNLLFYSKKLLIPIVFILVCILGWTMYAKNYNARHDCTYFSTTIFPIWKESAESIHGILDRIRDFWLGQYFHTSVLLFIASCFLFIFLKFRKANQVLLFVVLAIFAEAIVFVLLQFTSFNDHDYFTIDLYILLLLTAICAFELLQRNYARIFNSLVLKTLALLFLIFNIYYAQSKVNARYNSWMNSYEQEKDFYSITPYLRQLGINANDTVIAIPDGSHLSLYLMNQKGWTEFTDARFHSGSPVFYNQDSKGIQSSVNKGAKYMIVENIDQLMQKPYLQPFCTYLIGTYNDALVFQLKNKKDNFNLLQPEIARHLLCGAEKVTPDKQYFTSDADSALFSNGETRSEEYAHTGKYSAKLNVTATYGMAVKFRDLNYAEIFTVSAWRKIDPAEKSYLVVSGDSYYNDEYKVIESDASGWEKISKKFCVPKSLAGKEIAIYIYNPGSNYVYFDDFEITRYKSAIK